MSRKLKFDLTVNANALLCPNPEEFYSKAYINQTTADNFRVLPGIKSATKLAISTRTDLLAAATCAFSATPETLDAVDIDVCSLSVMSEICQFDLEQSFLSMQMAQGSNGNWQVSSYMNWYWNDMSNQVAQEVEYLRWKGNTAGATGTYLDECDGHEKKLAADATVIDIAKPLTLDETTVIGYFTDVFTAAPTEVHSSAEARFYVARDVANFYRIAVSSANTLAYVTKDLELTFLGVPIVVCDGMSNGKMVFTRKDNLIYAFDAEGDQKALKAIDLRETTAEPYLRTRANLKVGFYHVNGDEIVYGA